MKTWKSIFKSKQVRKECLYSFLILMGIRLLATIPTPGTNPDYFKTLIHDNSALTFIDAMTGKGANVYSIRPGKETAAYLHKKSNEVVLIGAVGLCVIAMVPAVLSGIWHLSGIAFLGTSIVIAVGVSLEFRTQCIAKSQNGKYSSMLEKGGIF